MDGNLGGLGLCVAYTYDRCPYADPYHWCSYHGIETDLLNLTACWGYELWRFSTTCTLVIESVKATSVIFLLGFGSFVCYKLYNHYRKKIGGEPSPGNSPNNKKKKKKTACGILTKWASKELIDSLSDVDNDVHNIESKYFGPDEITATTNDEVTSPGSDRDTSSPFPLDSPVNVEHEDNDDEETSSELTTTDSDDPPLDYGMGNLACQYEPVLYNTQSGVTFANELFSSGDQYLSPPSSPRPRSMALLVRQHVDDGQRRHSYSHSHIRRHSRQRRSFNLGALISSTRRHSINASSLDLIPLHNGAGEALADRDGVVDHVVITSDQSVITDFEDWHVSDADADIESLGSPSVDLNVDSEDDEDGSDDDVCCGDGASLKANFSPGSIVGRGHLLDRLPPDGADDEPAISSRGGNLSEDFSTPDDDDVNVSEALKEPLTFQDDDTFGLDTDYDEDMFASSAIRGDQRACLTRHRSSDSIASDDTSTGDLFPAFREDIGSTTVANLDQLLNNLQQVKQSCLNLDEHIVHLKGGNLSEVEDCAKSPLADESASITSQSSTTSAMELVRKCKSRATFRGLLDTGVAQPMTSDSANTTGSSSGLPSAHASLEWDLPAAPATASASITTSSSNNNNNNNIIRDSKNQPASVTAPVSASTIDSGSDFGTPLMSESPEPGKCYRVSSPASLEWEEEFSGGDGSVPVSPRQLSIIVGIHGHGQKNNMGGAGDTSDERTMGLQLQIFDHNCIDLSCDERIVPGQSRECSPGDDTRVILVRSSNNTNDEQVFNKTLRSPEAIRGGGGSLNRMQMWSCTESGFVEEEDNNDGDSNNNKNCNNPAGLTSPVSSQPEAPRRRRKKESGSGDGDGAGGGVNRDSAFCEGLEIGFSRMQENIGEKWELIQYSETEWRGHTQRAETIRKGYAHIPSTLECFHLRRIRGDNYCAIRAALFQVLVQGLPLLSNFNGCSAVCQKLESWTNSPTSSWLRGWSFGSRLPYSRETCIQGFKECVESLNQLSLSSICNTTSREEFLVDQFNADPNLDVRLMEAVKLLMLTVATELHEASMTGADVPIFAILLFARETSETPRAFMENHLNFMGDSGGLEQVEMYLLGHTLGVTLRIVRPSSFGSDDYICYYPERADNRPEVNLIAEDDRHYNIIVK